MPLVVESLEPVTEGVQPALKPLLCFIGPEGYKLWWIPRAARASPRLRPTAGRRVADLLSPPGAGHGRGRCQGRGAGHGRQPAQVEAAVTAATPAWTVCKPSSSSPSSHASWVLSSPEAGDLTRRASSGRATCTSSATCAEPLTPAASWSSTTTSAAFPSQVDLARQSAAGTVDDLPVTPPTPTPPGGSVWRQRLDSRPLHIS